MPRTARFIEPNGFYHVISRAINESWILKDNADFVQFLQLERKAKKKFSIRLFHYVLMNTHFHFVLQALTKEKLAQHIAYLKWNYTKWFRKKYGWKGPLWRERYKSLPIENESYLASCGLYVEYNPVRANMCTSPSAYPFSSSRKYLLGIPDKLLDEYSSNIDRSDHVSIDYQSNLSKAIFSHSPAVGSSIFIEQYRSRQNGYPKK